MRDQPFSKNLVFDKSKLDSYKYPTYQHYYHNKPSQSKEALSPEKREISSDKNITDTDSDHQTVPSRLQKKSTKTSLKA